MAETVGDKIQIAGIASENDEYFVIHSQSADCLSVYGVRNGAAFSVK